MFLVWQWKWKCEICGSVQSTSVIFHTYNTRFLLRKLNLSLQLIPANGLFFCFLFFRNNTLWGSLEEPNIIDPKEFEDLFSKAMSQPLKKPLSDTYEKKAKAKKVDGLHFHLFFSFYLFLEITDVCTLLNAGASGCLFVFFFLPLEWSFILLSLSKALLRWL